MPIIILTNENTASSSEILAGALKDLGKAKIVGTKTYGKDLSVWEEMIGNFGRFPANRGQDR